MIKHIVSVSSGVPSALVAILAIEQFGADNVDLVFADTLVEHRDNYRFLRDIEAFTGKQITRLCDGRTPLEVADDDGIIPNQFMAHCTHRLKIELIADYVNELKTNGYEIIMHIGFDTSAKDVARVPKNKAGWQARGIEARYLLIENEIYDPKNEIEKRGIRIPETYSWGLKHANCLSDKMGGCVKFGRGDMLKVLQYNPEGYAVREKWEINAIVTRWLTYGLFALFTGYWPSETLEYEFYTFLRDNTGEYDGLLTLKRFREEYQTRVGNQFQLKLFALENDLAGCSVECGVSEVFAS